MGSTKNEELYQFTHQTFLEYFAAAYLFRTHSTPTSMFNTLRSRIAKTEWDVVAQLAFQIQNKQVEGAGDKLLIALIKEAYKSQGNKRWNFLSFNVRCLGFIIPSPKTLQDITRACLDLTLNWGIEKIQQSSFQSLTPKSERNEETEVVEEIFGNLLIAANENRKTIAISIERMIIEYIRNASDTVAILALEIGLSFRSILRIGSTSTSSSRFKRQSNEELINFWQSISSQILSSSNDRIKTLCQKSLLISYLAYSEDKINIDDLVKWHGVASLFSNCSYNLRPNISRTSIIEIINSNLQKPDLIYDPNLHKIQSDLRKIGDFILSSLPPWTLERGTNFFAMEKILQPSQITAMLNQDNSLHFATFIIFAINYESNIDFIKKIDKFDILRSNTQEFIPTIIINLFHAYKFSITESDIQREIDICGFSNEQQNFVWKWMRQEIHLVQ